MSGPNKSNARRSRRLVGCVGATVALLLGFCVLLVIVTPIAFRSLDEDWQFRFVRRFPFMADWQIHPTAPFDALPTMAASADNNALSLLSTPTAGSMNVQVP